MYEIYYRLGAYCNLWTQWKRYQLHFLRELRKSFNIALKSSNYARIDLSWLSPKRLIRISSYSSQYGSVLSKVCKIYIEKIEIVTKKEI